jgi:putative membrane protein
MNTSIKDQSKIKKVRTLIILLSIAIPAVVAVLFKVRIDGVDFSFLPPIYAGINGLTAILLVAALLAIKQNKRKLHENIIKTCLLLSVLFLGAYVAYHMTSDPTPYGGNNAWIYYSLLVSHIILSVAVIPVVLFAYLFAWQGDFKRHKKWTRFAWPIWFYVAVTGVVVYIMISPYYV